MLGRSSRPPQPAHVCPPPGRSHSHTHCRSRSHWPSRSHVAVAPGRASPRDVCSGLSPLPATCSVLRLLAACQRGARGPPRPSGAHQGPPRAAWVPGAACPHGSPSLPAATAGLTSGLPRLGPFPQHLPQPPAPPRVDSPRGACPPGSRHLPSPLLPSRSPSSEPLPTLAQPPPSTCLILWSPKVPRLCPAAPSHLCRPLLPRAGFLLPALAPAGRPAGSGSVRRPPQRVAWVPLRSRPHIR